MIKKTCELGIWMDHCVAYLIEFTTKPFAIQKIVREFPIEEKNENPSKKKESISRNKKSNLNRSYNEIGQSKIKYNKVALFGPTDAKIDFFDFLFEDEQFWKLKIEIKEWIAP